MFFKYSIKIIKFHIYVVNIISGLLRYFSQNCLTGSIPPEISRWTKLETLYCPIIRLILFYLHGRIHFVIHCRLVNNNNLSGSVPTALNVVPTLLVLHVILTDLKAAVLKS